LFPLYACFVDNSSKFVTGINNTSGTGGKLAAGVIEAGGAPSLANISANLKKKSK
jgi:hypothetical protein